MAPPRLALDLFSGTGSATEPLRRRGWKVIRVDSSSAARADVRADVRALPLRLEPGAVSFLWASPPCTEFSLANPQPRRSRRPSLELIHATLELVADLRPRYWILENVRGAIPFLGIPAQKVGPFCLWGYFPQVRATLEGQTYQKRAAYVGPRRAAAVPAALAEAVADALELHLDAGAPSLLDLRPFRKHRHRARRAQLLEGGLPDLLDALR